MPVLTTTLITIASVAAVTSLAVGAAGIAATVIGKATGNKTLMKIGKIAGYVSMATGVLGAGVGMAAVLGAGVGTGTMMGMTVGTAVAETGAGAGAATGAAQGVGATTASTIVKQAAATGVKSAASQTIQQAANTGTTAAQAALTAEAAAPSVTGVVTKAASPLLGAAQTVAPQPAVTTPVTEPYLSGSDEIRKAQGSILDRVPHTPVQKSMIPDFLSRAWDGAGDIASSTGKYLKDNPWAAVGLIQTVGAGMGSLFESQVADADLKEKQRQFNQETTRRNSASYI